MNLVKFARQVMLTIIFATVMAFAWVGAEYVIYGVIHTSNVDDIACGLFAGVLACYVERTVWGDT